MKGSEKLVIKCKEKYFQQFELGIFSLEFNVKPIFDEFFILTENRVERYYLHYFNDRYYYVI